MVHDLKRGREAQNADIPSDALIWLIEFKPDVVYEGAVISHAVMKVVDDDNQDSPALIERDIYKLLINPVLERDISGNFLQLLWSEGPCVGKFFIRLWKANNLPPNAAEGASA